MPLGILAGILGSMGASAVSSVLGSKKRTKIPPWQSMDIGSTVGSSIDSNIANLSKAADLSSKESAANTQQTYEMLQRTIPGFEGLSAQLSKVYERGLRGEMSIQDAQQTALKSASGAVAGGYGASGDVAGGMLGNRVARDYGLRQQDIIDKNVSSFQSWTRNIASIFEPGMVNVQSSFLSPAQWVSQVQSDKENQWKVAMGQAIEKAQPGRGAMAASGAFGTAASIGALGTGIWAGNQLGAPTNPNFGTGAGWGNQAFDQYGSFRF